MRVLPSRPLALVRNVGSAGAAAYEEAVGWAAAVLPTYERAARLRARTRRRCRGDAGFWRTRASSIPACWPGGWPSRPEDCAIPPRCHGRNRRRRLRRGEGGGVWDCSAMRHAGRRQGASSTTFSLDTGAGNRPRPPVPPASTRSCVAGGDLRRAARNRCGAGGAKPRRVVVVGGGRRAWNWRSPSRTDRAAAQGAHRAVTGGAELPAGYRRRSSPRARAAGARARDRAARSLRGDRRAVGGAGQRRAWPATRRWWPPAPTRAALAAASALALDDAGLPAHRAHAAGDVAPEVFAAGDGRAARWRARGARVRRWR